MDALQKGSLTVVVATVITSAMILLAGNSIAENKSEEVTVKRLEQAVIGSETSINSNIPASADVITKVENQEATSDVTSYASDLLVSKHGVIPPPPPGLFIDYSSVGKMNSQVAVPAQREIPFVRMKPTMDFLVNPSPQAPAKPSQPSVDLSAPTIKKPEMVEPKMAAHPNKPVKIANIPDVPQQIKGPEMSAKQPIWMRKQPIIDSKNRQPRYSNKRDLQNNERGGMYPSQKYMFVPAPVYFPSYGYPQMPVIGAGGYYYAPVPQHKAPQNNTSTSAQKPASIKEKNK